MKPPTPPPSPLFGKKSWRVIVFQYKHLVGVKAVKDGEALAHVYCRNDEEVARAKVLIQKECDERNRAEAWAADAVRRER